MPRDRAAIVSAFIAAGVAFSGVIIMGFIYPQYLLWILLAGLFVTVPPILVIRHEILSGKDDK